MVISFITTHRQDSPDSNTNRPACSQLLKHNINTNKSYEYYILPYTYINTITIIYYSDKKCRKKSSNNGFETKGAIEILLIHF